MMIGCFAWISRIPRAVIPSISMIPIPMFGRNEWGVTKSLFFGMVPRRVRPPIVLSRKARTPL